MLNDGLGLWPALALFHNHARKEALQIVERRLSGGRQPRKQEVESMHGSREVEIPRLRFAVE